MSVGVALVMMFALGALLVLNAVVPVVVVTWGRIRGGDVASESDVNDSIGGVR